MTIKSANQIKVIIADDHPLFRRGLKHAFSETDDITVAGEVDNGEDLLRALDSSGASVVLMDIAMPGKSALEVLKQLKTDHPKLPVLMLSVYPEEQYAARFIRAGASGYLNKESAHDKLVEATRKLARGGRFVSPKVMEILAFDFSDSDKPLHDTLSNREYQVFGMIAEGKSLTEIGNELSLSVKTISTHRTRILEKMKMKNNAELIHYAIINHLI